MEKFIKVLSGLLSEDMIVLLVSGITGSLVYAAKEKLHIMDSLIAVFVGASAAIAMSPVIVAWAGIGDSIRAHGAVGFCIGLLFHKLSEIVLKVLDYFEDNPRFIGDIIRSKFGSKKEDEEIVAPESEEEILKK